MCGIAGLWRLSDSFAADAETVVRMRDALAHRGPDDAGVEVWPQAGVALAHRRLSIVDLSPAGHQPMANEDGSVWITYNGEVYNHEALRSELEAKGHVYRSRTDTETILHLYEEEGPRCVERLDGMFALAIWDARRRELFLARDRLGVKPLYYASLPGGFLFGSEIRALVEHPALTPELDEEAFFDYLTFAFSPAPMTMYRGVRKLAPAERLVVGADGSVRTDRYWTPFDPRTSEQVGEMSEGEIEARLLELLRRSIAERTMADVPFGVFLSGGLDSSTNVALMAELIDRPVRTFSTAPAQHPEYDELEYARAVAAAFGTDHHEILVDDGDLERLLPELLEHQDEPLADWTAVPQYFVSRLAREHGTIVVQCGEGADELFHGYNGYVDHRRVVVPFQRYVPAFVRRPVGRAAVAATRRLGRGIRHGEALYDAAHSPLPYWGGSVCYRGPLKAAVVRNGGRHADSYAVVERLWAEADRSLPEVDLFQKMTYVELKQRLSELLLMRLDRMTMAHSVEGRDPFLDHQLVEFALALPPAMKYRRGIKKYALKRAVAGRLPDRIINRPKQGFGTPMPQWLRGEFGRRAQAEVRRSSLADRGLLDYDEIDALFAAHRAGAGDWSKHLWNVYSVSVWHDRWVAGVR
ncbi:MAG TPA: asparagine synthase (glutamine-hydrolyzing) [Solirubrobacteraceae bacterium]